MRNAGMRPGWAEQDQVLNETKARCRGLRLSHVGDNDQRHHSPTRTLSASVEYVSFPIVRAFSKNDTTLERLAAGAHRGSSRIAV